MKNSYYYIGANPTVDLVLIDYERKEVLMILRGPNAQACPDMWAMPGGFINTDAKPHSPWTEGAETPAQAAFRELQEETKLPSDQLNPEKLKFHGIYEGNGRDPRDNAISWSKSHVFYYILDDNEKLLLHKVNGADDAIDAKPLPLGEIQNMKLAFDHNLIIDNIFKELNNVPKMKM